MKTLRLTLTWLTFSLILVACAPQDRTPTVTANVQMSVRAEPEPLAVGEATLIVTLIDDSGSPIDGARLQLHGDMDHEGMTPVDRESSESDNGEYRVPFVWTMGGGWNVTITAELPNNGGEVSQTVDFFVEAVSSESVINRPPDSNTPDDPAITIIYQPDNDPVIGGDATISITLTDAEGRPITDAIVEVRGDMAHEGMMPITGEGEHEGDGEYLVPLRWTMAGDWQVRVSVQLADGGSLQKDFEQAVILQAE